MGYRIFVAGKPADGRKIKSIEGLPVVKPRQVHGSAVAFVAGERQIAPEADALVTDNRGIWIGVLTADCLPVFLVGEGMVGIVHAGWRGTLKGITYNAVKYMTKFTRVLKAVLGVCICEKCYEVGKDLKERFPSEYARCFLKRKDGRYTFDLKGANIIQLRIAGVEEIESMEGCTVCGQGFYSYREEKTEKRNLFAIRLE